MTCRVWTALSTAMVALVLALAVPASQLRTISVTHSCCCPDPAKCHCPDHDGRGPGQPVMRACHQTTHVSIAPVLPAFTAPAMVILSAPVTETVAAFRPLLAPPAAPTPNRPDAPS